MKSVFFISLFVYCLSISAQEADVTFQLNTKKRDLLIKPTMYGLFFEDINFGADGGLYAELVKNRSFDFSQHLMGWYTLGNVKVREDNSPFPNNPTYLQLSAPNHRHKHTGIENEGFQGMGFKKDETYHFSVWAKKENSKDNQNLRIELINASNDIIATNELIVDSDQWTQYEVVMTPRMTEKKGRLRVFLTTHGSVCLDHVSFFPTDTWK